MAFAPIGHGSHVSMLDGNSKPGARRPADVHDAGARRARPPREAGARTSPHAVGEITIAESATRLPDVRTGGRAQGFIPGSTLVLWQSLFRDVKTAKFKSKDEIRAPSPPRGSRWTRGRHLLRRRHACQSQEFRGELRRRSRSQYVGSRQDWMRRVPPV
jgi:hypothetical protein